MMRELPARSTPSRGRGKARDLALASGLALLAARLAAPGLVLVVGHALLAAPLQAQEEAGADAGADQDASDGLPELGPAERQELERALGKLATNKETARRAAEQEIIALGRGALPALIADASTGHASKQVALYNCLVALADERDRDSVAEALASEHVVLRRFGAHEAGVLGLPALLEGALALLDDEDAMVRQEAALSVAAHGYEQALAALLAVWPPPPPKAKGSSRSAPKEPPEAEALRARILAALGGLRDKGTHAELAVGLEIDAARDKEDPEGAAARRRATVAMLAAIGDAAAVRNLALALEDPHNLVQRDAIDALRHLLEDEPPFDGGSIFAQINEVKRLKEVLKASR